MPPESSPSADAALSSCSSCAEGRHRRVRWQEGQLGQAWKRRVDEIRRERGFVILAQPLPQDREGLDVAGELVLDDRPGQPDIG